MTKAPFTDPQSQEFRKTTVIDTSKSSDVSSEGFLGSLVARLLSAFPSSRKSTVGGWKW
jgi:hypothetical protein